MPGRVVPRRVDPVEGDAAPGGVESRCGKHERSGAVRDVAHVASGVGLRRAEEQLQLTEREGRSDSAVARCVISPTTERPGDGSSASPQRPIPVSSLR